MLAQENGEEEKWPISDFLDDIGKVLPPAFVIAFVTSMLGYLRTTKPEDFELAKFGGTMIISILLGFVTSATGWDYTTAEIWLANAGITVWIYWGMKVLAIKLGWIETETPTQIAAP